MTCRILAVHKSLPEQAHMRKEATIWTSWGRWTRERLDKVRWPTWLEWLALLGCLPPCLSRDLAHCTRVHGHPSVLAQDCDRSWRWRQIRLDLLTASVNISYLSWCRMQFHSGHYYAYSLHLARSSFPSSGGSHLSSAGDGPSFLQSWCSFSAVA